MNESRAARRVARLTAEHASRRLAVGYQGADERTRAMLREALLVATQRDSR